MPLFLSGSNGVCGADGTAALPAVQGTDGDTGVFFPAANQVAIATNGVQRLLVDASGIVTGTAGNLMLVSGTAVASTSGTAIDFTGIPSWVRRITVMFSGVSTNGTNSLLVQLGTSGGFVTTGYISTSNVIFSSSTSNGTSSTSGLAVFFNAAGDALSGAMTITSSSGNAWVSTVIARAFTNSVVLGGGNITLGGTLDRIRITTVGGTDTFDAGSVNILFE